MTARLAGPVPTPRGFTHPELLLQLCAACRIGREDAVDVSVQLRGGHLRLSAQDVLHQSVVDENILLLRGDSKCSKSEIYIRYYEINKNRKKRLAIMRCYFIQICIIDHLYLAAETVMRLDVKLFRWRQKSTALSMIDKDCDGK